MIWQSEPIILEFPPQKEIKHMHIFSSLGTSTHGEWSLQNKSRQHRMPGMESVWSFFCVRVIIFFCCL